MNFSLTDPVLIQNIVSSGVIEFQPFQAQAEVHHIYIKYVTVAGVGSVLWLDFQYGLKHKNNLYIEVGHTGNKYKK